MAMDTAFTAVLREETMLWDQGISNSRAGRVAEDRLGGMGMRSQGCQECRSHHSTRHHGPRVKAERQCHHHRSSSIRIGEVAQTWQTEFLFPIYHLNSEA